MTSEQNTIIGTIEVPEGVIHDASYETAAWYRTFEHPAQICNIRRSGKWMLYTIEGRTTHEHFPSLWGGVPTGGGTMGDCDKPSTYTVQTYDYLIAEAAERGDVLLDTRFALDVSYMDHPIMCLGYVNDYDKPIGHRQSPCGHDHHLDAHQRPTKTERNARGYLEAGYIPGETNRRRHVRIVERQAVSS